MKTLTLSAIALLLVIGFGIYHGVFNEIVHTKTDKAKQTAKMIHIGITTFYVDHGRLPSDEEGLEILKKKDIFRDFPIDPWGNEFIYRVVDSKEHSYSIKSLGSDGLVGGVEFAEDIVIDFKIDV